ncbi:alpha/beta fold hydrolase [Sporichthya polymorpha]|uniref:alpha/beta fold hydrolase n=1 Tax=Sporichthya polymorpha TaxID=35751 RepID=UPI000372CBD9|nr:alpha/beta hydrolase [Sporichthya polymorpha]
MNSPERIDLPGAGLRLAADAAGPEDGPPVLLLHGGGQSRRSWGRALEALAEAGARAVAADLRGHGDSDWAPDATQYRPEHFAADVVRAVEAVSERSGGRPVLVVGASMGGVAAMVAAPQLHDRLTGLVLVDVVANIRMDGARRVLDFMKSAPDGFATLEEAADAVAAYLPHRPRPSDHEGLKRNLRQRPDGRWVWHWDPRLVTEDALDRVEDVHNGQLDDSAAAIRVPTLLVRGLLSDIVDEDGVAHLKGLVPQLEVVDIADAAHTAATDDNDAFVTAVLEFTGRVAAGVR